MPQQGARAAVGDQGGRGAVLTPSGKLTFAGAGVIVGGALVAAGTRMPWVDVTLRGAQVDAQGLPAVFLGPNRVRLSGADLGAGYLFGLGLLLALVPLGWLVVGPTGRIVLGAVGIALAAGILVGVWDLRSGSTERAVVLMRQEFGNTANIHASSRFGPDVTSGGAELAVLAALAGAIVGRRVPKMRMPEPPDKGAAA
ncbi:MAG: Trp biosynthesis-associated membrane protein [Actinomycetota bacterium]